MELRFENLAMLYQGAFTAAVRIQAKRQQAGNAMAFRHRMKDVLNEIGREATRRNYTSAHVSETNFAFVALLDEVILSSSDPCREDWAKRPLQEDLFGLSTAGEQFFSHLDNLLSKPDSAELIDVLEVYYLCLLLEFEGRYINRGRAQSQLYADRARQRIERFRGVRTELSPSSALPSERLTVSGPDASFRRLGIIAASGASLAVLFFVVFSIHLLLMSSSVNAALSRVVVP